MPLSVWDRIGVAEDDLLDSMHNGILSDINNEVSSIDDAIKEIAWNLQEIVDGDTEAPDVKDLALEVKQKLSKICERLY